MQYTNLGRLLNGIRTISLLESLAAGVLVATQSLHGLNADLLENATILGAVTWALSSILLKQFENFFTPQPLWIEVTIPLHGGSGRDKLIIRGHSAEYIQSVLQELLLNGGQTEVGNISRGS